MLIYNLYTTHNKLCTSSNYFFLDKSKTFKNVFVVAFRESVVAVKRK